MSARPPRDSHGFAQQAARAARARRDAGLRKVSRLTGWALAGALALTGGISEVAAHAKPGHSKPARSTQRTTAAPSTGARTQTETQPSPDVIQAPQQAPVPSDSGGGAVSGGS